MRLNLVRNDKELQALGHEVESLKESNQRLESEVLASMEAAEPRAPRIKELTELIAGKRTELKAAEKEIAGQVEELKMSIQRQRVERDRAAQIDRRRAVAALPDDLQPARRPGGRAGKVRHLPGMPDAAAAAALQRDPEASSDPLLPQLPAHPLLRGRSLIRACAAACRARIDAAGVGRAIAP